jgi:hypothetical protein
MAGGVEPAQNIASAQYTINSPSWIEGAIAYPMASADGALDNVVEDVIATIDTSGWGQGRHTIFVESQDENGNWGAPTALFVTVVNHLPNSTKVRIIPKRVSFGSIKKGMTSGPKNIKVFNAGPKDMEITSIEMVGPDRSDFSHTHDCHSQLLPGSSCSIAVAVHPSGFGKCNAALVVSSNDAKRSIKNILLRANTKPPVLSSGPGAISFGVLRVTQSLTKTITLTNRGFSDLEVQDVSIEDDLEGNFDYVNTCGVIPRGESCNMSATFLPQTIGKKVATLAIISNDPKSPRKTIRFAGHIDRREPR